MNKGIRRGDLGKRGGEGFKEIGGHTNKRGGIG
jgi:hypothetical protein